MEEWPKVRRKGKDHAWLTQFAELVSEVGGILGGYPYPYDILIDFYAGDQIQIAAGGRPKSNMENV